MSTGRTIPLPSGQHIPVVGLGTWQSKPGEVRTAVAAAIKAGYRHIDAAWAYQNEAEVGQGIKDAGVPREQLFITSKLFEHHHHPDMVPKAIADTLKNLDCGYLDLYLMHWPAAIKPDAPADGSLSRGMAMNSKGKPDTDYELSNNHVPTWRAMEALVEQGKAKNIGVSNFNIRRTRNLMKEAKIPIAANQCELSVAVPQFELVEWMQRHNIVMEAYSPLGSTGAPHAKHELIQTLAKKYSCEPANILLSWLISRGIVALPKSVTPSRIESNYKDVKLSDEDTKSITDWVPSVAGKRVCDQSDDFDFDIFEENNPENNDKVQSKKD